MDDYGGQAVIEGVMIRGKEGVAVAVRRPSSEIVVRRLSLPSWLRGISLFNLPLFRGLRALIEALYLGVKSLQLSADEALEEEEEDISLWEMILSIGLAFFLAVILFVVLPAAIIRFIQSYLASNLLLNLVEGLIKVVFFLSYIILISRMEDIRRVFQYHGAEHKVIHAFEQQEELLPETAIKHSSLHPRCGTSFLLIVILISILFFSFFGRPTLVRRIMIHMALLPLIAGTAYEVIRMAGKKKAPFLIRMLSWPGLMLQRLTTREPDLDQIEVAIRALEELLQSRERGENFGSNCQT